MAFLRSRRPSFRNNRVLQQYVLTDVTPTGKILGTGSYGYVLEVTYGKLECAAKKMHDSLLQTDNQGLETLVEKYEQECQIMASLRHPNITQFLGICYIPDSRLPLLVMEQLDMSLDDLLEYVPNLPPTLKVSFLEDVSRGLDYLHKRDPPIVHRDLTAKNILLTSSLSAKITDMGNSRIVSMRPGQLARTLSQLPGTLVYMPPEALSDDHRYGPSLDIFSLGHLALYTLTQVFPGNLLPYTYQDPNNRGHLRGRTEVERRATHIEKLDTLVDSYNQALIDLVKQCLDDTPKERPSSEDLLGQFHTISKEVERSYGGSSLKHIDVGRVQVAKDMKRYQEQTELEMRRQVEDKIREIDNLQQQAERQHDQLQHQEGELQHQREELQHQREELQHKEEELQHQREELQHKDEDHREELTRQNMEKRQMEGESQQRKEELEQIITDLQESLSKSKKVEDELRHRLMEELQKQPHKSKNYYIEFDNLREKYRGYEGRLKSYSKAIADCARVKVEVEVKRNKTVQFVVIGGSKGVYKALELIQKNFEISKVKPETISHLSTSEESSGSDSDTNDEGDDDMDSTAGEVGDFEQDSGDELSEPDETEPNTSCDSRRRREASDSDSSDDEGKGSVKSSEDSGIGTLSNTGTESDIDAGNVAAPLSNCSFYSEFPGVAFSKTANEGTLTSLGGEISGTGIQLTIPQDAIPGGDSIVISLKACIGGPFYLPKGFKFVSPVFLVQPPVAFHKKVILEMEIFAELEENELVFVTSSSKPDIVDDEAEWKFKVTNTKPKFCDEKKSGMVNVNHFCFFSLGGRSTAEVKYWSLYYPPKYFNSSCLCHVIFSVSIASKVYRENLERFIREQYKDGDFDRDLQSITFSSDSVTITVGDVQQKEYLVCPLSHPCKIFKKDLQVYKKKKTAKDYAAYPPRIVLKIVQEPTATSTFMHTFEVDGIPTIKTFHILIQPSSDMRPQQLRQVSGGSEASGSSSASLLHDIASSLSSESGQEDGSSSKSRCTEPVIPTMKDLMKYLHPIAPKWKMLGVNLEMDMGTIRAVENDRDSAEDCLLELLSRWEDAVNSELHNWETIYKAVKEPSLRASNVADVIKAKFLS